MRRWRTDRGSAASARGDQMRTELADENAVSAGFWIVLSAMAATTAMTAAAMQDVMKTRMFDPFGELDSPKL
jgi:hypothetical protein